MEDVVLFSLVAIFCGIVIFLWILEISYGFPFDYLIGDMPYWYYVERKNYIGLNKAIKKTILIEFNPDTIKYNDIDDVCRAVKNSASKVYPTLLNEQVIDNIKFLYQNGIYVEVWNDKYFNNISVPYKSVQKYVENPTTSCGDVVMAEDEFLKICEKLKKENTHVK